MLQYFEDLANQAKEQEQLPDWVNPKNASFKAYKCINALKEERHTYIRRHCRPTHFKQKKSYQISGAEVARTIEIAKPTLLKTSTYSAAVKCYLEQVNNELMQAMEARLRKTATLKSRGPIAQRKDELVEQIQALKKENQSLKIANAEQQVEAIFNQLSLPVRKKLHIKSGEA